MARSRLLMLVFSEMLATAVMERALYFFTGDRLGFSNLANLGLALAFGAVYIGAASGSSALSGRLGQKRALGLVIAGLMVLHGCLAAAAAGRHAWAVVALALGVAMLTGIKWPVIQSYVAAGQTPRRALRALGWFNVLWSSAAPIGIAASGPIIGSRVPWALFLIAATMNVLTLGLMTPLSAEPAHLPHDHPERPPAHAIARFGRLLVASRWGLVASYTMVFLVSPLMPHIFASLGYPVAVATGLAALLDLSIVIGFLALTLTSAWHDRAAPIAAGVIGLPIGFLMVLLGGSTAVVVPGEVLLGLSLAMVYHASLYYAQTIRNAAVSAGGQHESLIGLGFVLGPAVGMIGLGLTGVVGGYVPGMLLAVGPMIVVCVVGGLRPLVKLVSNGGPGDATKLPGAKVPGAESS